MTDKEKKRQLAYEALIILGMLALLTFICRLWPILLLIILGIFIAASTECRSVPKYAKGKMHKTAALGKAF